jgi:glutathione S-transferase
LDQAHPERRLFPTGTEGILVRMVEEWLDEWFPRVVIHYRWNIPENAAFAGATLAAEMFPFLPGFIQRKLGAKVASWGKRAVRALAIDAAHQKTAVEAELARLLGAAEAQLQVTPYLLGDRPTAADAAMMGALRAHIGFDPSTSRILTGFPTVVQWMKGTPAWDGSGAVASLQTPTDFARFVLDEAQGAYQTFIVGNANALAAGEKAFMADIHGAEVSLLARKYPETSRQVLRSAIAESLSDEQKSAVAAFLDARGLGPAFG